MTIEIRPCRPSDGGSLHGIWEAVRHHNARIDPRIVPEEVSRAEFLAGLEASLQRPAAAAFVAVEKGELVGFISAALEATQPDRGGGSHATIGYVYVDPRMRRAGVGQGLFEAVKRWARDRGDISHLEMPVLAADEEAAGFWRSIGFSPFIERLWAPLSDA